MKFAISFILTLNAFASPIQIFHEHQEDNAMAVKRIFTKKYMIPEELISLKKIENCDQLKNKGKLDVCLKSNGDLKVVSVDRTFIDESLKIFQAP